MPFSPHMLHDRSSAGHLCPASCLSYVHLGHWSFSPSPLCLLLYLPTCFSFLTSSSSSLKWFSLASRLPPLYCASSISSRWSFLVGLLLIASALFLEFSLLTAIWMIFLRSYSSAIAFSASVLSLKPPSRLILFMSSGVSFSQLWYRLVWSSMSARNSLKVLLPCSIRRRSMMALSLFTSLSSVAVVFFTTRS